MIIINEDFCIDVDDSNYIAKEDKHKVTHTKNGDVPVFRVIGYYSTLEGALRGIRNYMVKEALCGADVTLQDALSKVSEINNVFVDEFRKVISENEA